MVWSALHDAVYTREPVERLRTLILQDPTLLKEVDQHGNTPLHIGCYGGVDLEIVGLLIDLNPDPHCIEVKNDRGETPLHRACGGDALELVKLLVHKDRESVWATNDSNEIPLHVACAHGTPKTVEFLLSVDQVKSMSMARDSSGATPLQKACEKSSKFSAEVVTVLINHGSTHVGDNEGITPLHVACRHHRTQAAQILVDKYPESVKQTNRFGWTPVHSACASKPVGPELVRLLSLLVENHPELFKAKNSKGWIPLHVACSSYPSFEMIEYMIRSCPESVKTKTEDGDLPLHIAIFHKTPEDVVKLLVARYPDAVKIANNVDLTPLDSAVAREHPPEMVTFLQYAAENLKPEDVESPSALCKKIVAYQRSTPASMETTKVLWFLDSLLPYLTFGDQTAETCEKADFFSPPALQTLANADSPSAVRILSLDGGGVRGVAAITILKNLKDRMGGKEPHQIFDVICGTSTGGLIAILLGILKIPLEECSEIYEKMGEVVFDAPAHKKLVPPRFRQVAFDHLYNADALEELVKCHVFERLGDRECSLNDSRIQACLGGGDERTPYVFVVAKPSQEPYMFRNYESVVTNGRRDVKIWEAARATSAAPKFFSPITIGGLEFSDGGVGYNNPTYLALNEVKNMGDLKNRNKAYVLSIGTGLAHIKFTPKKSSLANVVSALAETATDCERVHRDVKSRLGEEPNFYARLNPGRGLAQISLDDHKFIPQMKHMAENYLADEDVQVLMKKLCERL